MITDDFDKEVLKEFENIEKTYISIKDLKVNLKSVNKKVKNKEEATEKLKNIWEEKMHPGAFTANEYQEKSRPKIKNKIENRRNVYAVGFEQ